MTALAIFATIFVIGWFGAVGANRSGAIMGPVWALVGAFIWAVGFYVAVFVTEQLLSIAGTAMVANGVFVVSRLVGIGVGIGLCYLFYKFVLAREPVTLTPTFLAERRG
jgi:hypothetical protein